MKTKKSNQKRVKGKVARKPKPGYKTPLMRKYEKLTKKYSKWKGKTTKQYVKWKQKKGKRITSKEYIKILKQEPKIDDLIKKGQYTRTIRNIIGASKRTIQRAYRQLLRNAIKKRELKKLKKSNRNLLMRKYNIKKLSKRITYEIEVKGRLGQGIGEEYHITQKEGTIMKIELPTNTTAKELEELKKILENYFQEEELIEPTKIAQLKEQMKQELKGKTTEYHASGGMVTKVKIKMTMKKGE